LNPSFDEKDWFKKSVVLTVFVLAVCTEFNPVIRGQEPDAAEALGVDQEDTTAERLATEVDDSMSIDLGGEGGVLVFRRLPKSDDISKIVAAGMPIDSSDQPAYAVPSVYLGETELTIQHLHSLLGPESWGNFKSRIKSYMGGPDDPKFGPYVRGVDTIGEDGVKEHQCPAILVGLGTVVEVCKRLENISNEAVGQGSGGSLTDQITEVTFRLPATKEWQYAARFTTDLDVAEERQIFPNWLDLNQSEDIGLRGQWADLCEAHGIPFKSSPTVRDVCEAADTVFAKGKNKAGYELLGEILKECMETSVHITRSDSQCILPVTDVGVNAWGLFGLFGNASEWTLNGESIADVDDFWGRISSGENVEEIGSHEMFAIMGGQFLNTFARSGAWKLWSIADGDGPLQTDVFQAESESSSAHDAFVDLKAGVRLCAHKKLSEDWFGVYRGKVLETGSVEAINDEFRKSFSEICATDEQVALSGVLEGYNTLKSKEKVFDSLDVVRQVTAALVDASEQLRSLTAAGKAALNEQGEAETINALAGLDLGILGDLKSKPDPGRKGPEQAGGKPVPTPVEFFEILKAVNSK